MTTRPTPFMGLGNAIFILSLSLGTLAFPIIKDTPVTNKSVIAQMFEWNWPSIAQECTDFLGPAGYGFVQTSPPMEHIQGSQWWTAYQPVSYTLTSNRGTRDEFAQMVATCNAAGVQIIADAVTNHMSGANQGNGTANSTFTHYVYPGTYQIQDFHHCGLTPDDNIEDYSNRAQVQTCQLEGLADLATDTDYVQGRIATYLKDLLSLGVTGLRMDAAKHIATSDIANIFSRVGPIPYVTQEVIYGDNEAVQPSEYVQNGAVQEFRYTSALQFAFSGDGIIWLQDLDHRGWIAGSGANAFVANHDTERGSSLSYKSPSNTYTLALVFSLAHPYGANPTILSSYLFNGHDDPAPNNWQGTCTGNTGANGWLCQHRWSPVAGLVGFRNAVGSDPLGYWQNGTHQQIAFGRGSSGFVVINNEDGDWSATFSTGLPDGTYCDVYTGPMSGSSCSGTSYTVSGGVFSATVAGRTGLALHTSAVLSFFTSTSSAASTSVTASTPSTSSVSGSATVTFSVNATTILGQNIYVTGDISQLGSWTPASGKALSSASYPVWVGSVSIPVGTTFNYKYTKVQGTTVTWESDPNRFYAVESSGAVTINDTWR